MYHIPVLLQESVAGLNINPDGIYVDATFGGGGHSKEILKHLSNKGKLLAIDQDIDAQKNIIKDKKFHLILGNFRYLKNYLDYYKINEIDGILADLGISSHQIDKKERGFSFRLGGIIDMRMNNSMKLTAAEILNTYEYEKIYNIFKKYCDILNPEKLTTKILDYRNEKKIYDINEFIELITPLAPKFNEFKYFAQVFQALRIAVNDEMTALEDFLNTIPKILKQGGRLSIISYHSLEDSLVKNLIKFGNTVNVDEINLFGSKPKLFKSINKKLIIPDDKEINKNSRSKSAKLRIAERI
ncbi:MAG: 16S rRNA (cytosine(1402)-N(4))-methyltransferase RsmH [Bacteroidales bacterium]|jgi:16S rRNA (cytosine1402-N4)-methyltransferase|nr:16S rRNA (cytosine(1402)-N(4))-methyltransferase RsmH [Bacteroidales bacterium]